MYIDALVGQQAKEVGEVAAAPWIVGVCSCPPPTPPEVAAVPGGTEDLLRHLGNYWKSQ